MKLYHFYFGQHWTVRGNIQGNTNIRGNTTGNIPGLH